MSVPNYSTWTDKQVLEAYTEALEGVYIDTPGTDEERMRALINASLDDVLRTPLGIEALKRKRKWGQPGTPPPPGTLPDAVPIANLDRLAIV